MGNPSPSLSLGLTCVFSLSLTTSQSHYSSSSNLFSSQLFPRKSLTSKSPLPKPSKATSSDLLSLLGTKQQASTVNAQVAQDLRSCFKFLVPLNPPQSPAPVIELGGVLSSKATEDELVWWPPEPVMELARLAVDSGADPAAIHRVLDPSIIPVPDIEGSNENRCELTRTSYGRHFINEELNSYLKFLFNLIASRAPSVGLNVSLNRFDLFHGHLFLAVDSGRLGILFHAKEYPRYEKDAFPYNMGYCQIGSNFTYDDSMNLRNILWLAPLASFCDKAWMSPGVLVVLDAHPGGIIYRDLVPEYVDFVRTLYEDDFGTVVVDVNYLNVGGAALDYQIFIC